MHFPHILAYGFQRVHLCWSITGHGSFWSELAHNEVCFVLSFIESIKYISFPLICLEFICTFQTFPINYNIFRNSKTLGDCTKVSYTCSAFIKIANNWMWYLLLQSWEPKGTIYNNFPLYKSVAMPTEQLPFISICIGDFPGQSVQGRLQPAS